MKNPKVANIILFDGVCNLCEYSVQFIIKHDSKNYFHFTSQSSEIGQELLKQHELEEIDSIIFVKDSMAYAHSDAALEIAKNLDGWHKHLYIFRFIPKVLRDAIYRFVAKHRYKVFGKKDSCMMPSIELKDRFLE
jgi:predicted DCC family thiol-disulfide oxidoreductase YuxK